MTNSIKKQSLSFYVWCFFACSFLGWVYETVWKTLANGTFTNSGFLYGWYVPIYGFGGLILIFTLRRLVHKKIMLWKINLMPIVLFIFIVLIVSTVEYVASVILELLFHARWWDYSHDTIHINGRVSLRNSSILGALGFLFVYVIHPLLQKICAKIPRRIMVAVAILILLVMGIDLIFTLLWRY